MSRSATGVNRQGIARVRPRWDCYNQLWVNGASAAAGGLAGAEAPATGLCVHFIAWIRGSGMAQQQQSARDTSHDTADVKPTPFLHTGQGLILGGLVVLVLSAGCAVLANVGLARSDVAAAPAVTQTIITYAVFMPAALLGVLGLVLAVAGAVRWGVFGRSGAPRHQGDEAARQVELLASINRRILLSETGKRLAYRQEDIAALRQTIQQDLDQGDYDAALVLVDQLADVYGAREEAEEFREQIHSARNQEMEAKVSQALDRLEQLLKDHQFDRAGSEASKIQRLYPESRRAQGLMQRVSQAREQYKQDLERQFLEASERDDVDRAMDLLKELDKYLTEQEAEPFRETARGVIGKKRDNLGVQFKLAVQDKEWHQAVRVGEQIIREFPNTRMADEVRQTIDVLRQRSAEQKEAGGAARPEQPTTSHE
jgi:tetratricopeptide (TPR) repeat protein